MTGTYFHNGILVEDLDRAIAEFGERLGVEFTAPTVAHCDDFVDLGAERVLDLRVAYSKTEEPYYELLEAQEQGIYSREHAGGFGFHHVGVWDPDCEGTLARLQDRGLVLEAAQYDPDGRIIVAYLAPEGLAGIRYELVDEGRRPMMENWIGGGSFEDYV
jgi:catechol 2,3-dioxygenase-like lactoylglutathione lyase family enzyme